MTWLKYLTFELFTLAKTPVTPASLLVLLGSLCGAVIAARLAARGARRFLLGKGSSTNEGTAYAVSRIVQYVVLSVGVLLGFDNFGMSLGTLAAFGTFLSVGVGFGLQNIVQNFISGLILLIERPVKKGDFVKAGESSGTVDEIAMRATRIITRDGVAIIVPNSEFITGRVVNMSAPTTTYRVRVAVGVAYGSDTSRVRDTLVEIAKGHPKVLAEPTPLVFFRDFGDSALAFELCVWLDDPHLEPIVASDLRFAIDAGFRAARIEIPFPQRDVHIKGPPDALKALRASETGADERRDPTHRAEP